MTKTNANATPRIALYTNTTFCVNAALCPGPQYISVQNTTATTVTGYTLMTTNVTFPYNGSYRITYALSARTSTQYNSTATNMSVSVAGVSRASNIIFNNWATMTASTPWQTVTVNFDISAGTYAVDLYVNNVGGGTITDSTINFANFVVTALTTGSNALVNVPVPTLNAWNNITVSLTNSPNAWSIYVNGNKSTFNVDSTGGLLPTVDFGNTYTRAIIGQDASTNGFQMHGYIDDIRIYNKALTDAEALNIYAATNVYTVETSTGVGAGTDVSVTYLYPLSNTGATGYAGPDGVQGVQGGQGPVGADRRQAEDGWDR